MIIIHTFLLKSLITTQPPCSVMKPRFSKRIMHFNDLLLPTISLVYMLYIVIYQRDNAMMMDSCEPMLCFVLDRNKETLSLTSDWYNYGRGCSDRVRYSKVCDCVGFCLFYRSFKATNLYSCKLIH